MDATQYAESEYLNAELVKASPTKKAVIIAEATVETTDYGEKLSLQVEMDGKKKIYRPNKTTVEYLITGYGKETKGWLGKPIHLSTDKVMGKECIIGKTK